MDQTIDMNQDNNPGSHILVDLQNLELQYSQPRKNQDDKYTIYFLFFQGIVLLISLVSLSIGNQKQLGKPIDSNGNICGVSLGFEQYKYIYFTNPVNDKDLNITVCVRECPLNQNYLNDSFELQCIPNQFISTCKNTLSTQNFNLLYYDTLHFENICLPNNPKYLNNVLNAINKSQILLFFQDFNYGIQIIICTFLFCLLLNQIVYFLIIKLQKKIIWVILVALIISLIILALISLIHYFYENRIQQIKQHQNQKLTLSEIINIVQTQNYKFQAIQFPLIFSAFFVIMAIYYILDFILNYKKYRNIGLKIAIINYFYDYPQQTQLNSHYKSMFKIFYLIPIFIVLILVTIFFLWVFIANSILTIGSLSIYKYPFDAFQPNWITYIFGITHILELILIFLIVSGLSKFLTIGLIMENYRFFINQDQRYKQLNEYKSIWKILQYNFTHFGTIISGQILIIFLKIPKILVRIYLWIVKSIYSNYQTPNLISNILSINDRAYLLSYLKAKQFLSNTKSQYIFDQKMMDQQQIYQHGKQLTDTCCFAISNFCLFFTYILLKMTKTTIIIQEPNNFLFLSFFSSYFMTKFFTNIYGITIDILEILLYRDATSDGKIVGKSVKIPIRLLRDEII
ncbi:unnamed protein product [Paramecium sonneborni]|uniref:Choline transporter-like protein n=1 Tax=Paramecium sonneborni TaxID=65129 RepID=A0A8S1Q682_9CILI|nr:unnamed protein product [Paramecium sonneborni]